MNHHRRPIWSVVLRLNGSPNCGLWIEIHVDGSNKKRIRCLWCDATFAPSKDRDKKEVDNMSCKWWSIKKRCVAWWMLEIRDPTPRELYARFISDNSNKARFIESKSTGWNIDINIDRKCMAEIGFVLKRCRLFIFFIDQRLITCKSAASHSLFVRVEISTTNETK